MITWYAGYSYTKMCGHGKPSELASSGVINLNSIGKKNPTYF